MRTLIVTDAWMPQVNGVVYTWQHVLNHLSAENEFFILHPNVPGADTLCTIYYDVPVIKNAYQVVRSYVKEFEPDRIHIVTEGSLGFAMRTYCALKGLAFSTSYHSKLDDYAWVHYRIPKPLTKQYLRWFHGASRRVLVPTDSISRELGMDNTVTWGRGVDLDLFNRDGGDRKTPDGTIMFVGRVSKDKNLDDFCRIRGYRKIVVGSGPYLKELSGRYPDVEFVGRVEHERLGEWYRRADVFVFPSRLDTFGLVILEAMACGLPVVAYDVPGPRDIIHHGRTGLIGEDLEGNIEKAFKNLDCLSTNAADFTKTLSWQSVAEQFIHNIQ